MTKDITYQFNPINEPPHRCVWWYMVLVERTNILGSVALITRVLPKNSQNEIDQSFTGKQITGCN